MPPAVHRASQPPRRLCDGGPGRPQPPFGQVREVVALTGPRRAWRAGGRQKDPLPARRTIADCGRWIMERAVSGGWFDVSTLTELNRVGGKKTMGYELAEALSWRLPAAQSSVPRRISSATVK